MSKSESCRVKRQNSKSNDDKILQALSMFSWNNVSPFPKSHCVGWHNDYLHKRQGQEYTKLTISDLCKLGESWIVMFYAGNVNYIAPITVLLALHLKNPENGKELFSPFAQNPKFPPSFKGDPEKEMIKYSQHLTEIPSFLASEERMEEVEKLIKQEPLLYKLISGIKLMEAEKQAAFYSFLATITCRLVCKSVGHIEGIWERRAVKEFARFYNTPHLNFVLPPPNTRVFIHLKNFISLGSDLAVAVYKAFLPAYSEACQVSNHNVKRLLQFTFLQPTSMTGLAIITYVVKAAHCENFSSLTEFFLKLHKDAMKTSMKTVMDFMEKYPLARPPHPELDWWKWARNINEYSFFDLSLSKRDMRQLAIICMGLLATSEKDRIWNDPTVNVTKQEIRSIMQLLQVHKQSKNCNPRENDHNFNIDKEFELLHI